jgi:hypothetical protein
MFSGSYPRESLQPLALTSSKYLEKEAIVYATRRQVILCTARYHQDTPILSAYLSFLTPQIQAWSPSASKTTKLEKGVLFRSRNASSLNNSPKALLCFRISNVPNHRSPLTSIPFSLVKVTRVEQVSYVHVMHQGNSSIKWKGTGSRRIFR